MENSYPRYGEAESVWSDTLGGRQHAVIMFKKPDDAQMFQRLMRGFMSVSCVGNRVGIFASDGKTILEEFGQDNVERLTGHAMALDGKVVPYGIQSSFNEIEE